ncbi:MAG: nitroreductase family protein [Anaerolineaceae bacterium]
MNETLKVIHNRKSIRVFQDKIIDRETVDAIIQAAMRSPTAGNMMLYSIVEIEDQSLKDKLAVLCDDQPFIARSPLVLIFLADYQRWFDYFIFSGMENLCAARHEEVRRPGEGDLLMAAIDAVIAAQTAAIAAESLGLGSCYIGDILENYEEIRDLLKLPQYVLPVTMVCIGYPHPKTASRLPTSRFDQKYIHFKNTYHRLDEDELRAMFKDSSRPHLVEGAANFGQDYYLRKFASDFSVEMTRSVREMISSWMAK